MTRFHRILALLGAGAIAWLILAPEGHGRAATTSPVATPPPTLVRVAAVELASQTMELPFPGQLQADQRADLAFEVEGLLASRDVEIGDAVTPGQELARLDAAALRHARQQREAALAEARATARQLKLDLRRAEALADQKAATPEEVEQKGSALTAAEARLLAAESAAQEAQRRERESVLVAPFAGRIQAVVVEPGERVRVGQQILSIVGSGPLEVAVDLPESIIQAIEVGSRVRVERPQSTDAILQGTVQERGRAAKPGTRLFPVTVALDPEAVPNLHELLPGMSVEVYFPSSSRHELSVPLSAVIDPGSAGPRVARVRDARVEVVPVEPVRLLGDRVVVTGDLEADQLVVTAGGRGLLPGQAVEVAP